MRPLFLLALGAAALAACTAGSAGVSNETKLTVTFWEKGLQSDDRDTWTLRCNPARGTLPRPVVACQRLAAAGAQPFAPLPEGIVCTEIYGGPQVARVVGTISGRRVWATFTRQNGCHISRWNRISPWLVPAGGVRS